MAPFSVKKLQKKTIVVISGIVALLTRKKHSNSKWTGIPKIYGHRSIYLWTPFQKKTGFCPFIFGIAVHKRRNDCPFIFGTVSINYRIPHTASAVTIGVDVDSYIRSGSNSTNNYGTDTQIQIKNQDGKYNRKGYIRFDVSEQNDLTSLSAASFDFYMYSPDPGFAAEGNTDEYMTLSVYGLNDAHAGNAWDETGITWENAPANVDNGGDLVTTDVTALGTVDLDAPGAYNLSSTALIDFLKADSDGMVTLILTGEAGFDNTAKLASSENTDFAGPSLTLTTAVPEPSTSLLAIGSLFLGFMRRRR